ncbi:arginine--tRNA ligase, partial [Candidatus Gracilibacteria bacterium]|nr:arginine--tRNA ligase [Candidatus Gracilibacteria bacterium]
LGNFKTIESGKGKSIYVDYIGANVGKPLHIGHMCTPNQGQVMINVYKKLGYNVISDSHIGDWGIIFGKLITAFKKYGSEEKLQENAVEHLFELYVKISSDAETDETLEGTFREEFKKLSEGDKESINLWSKFTKESILAMNIQLGRMHIKPDYNIGESFYEGLGLPKIEDYPDLGDNNMKDVVDELVEKNIASITQNDDGTTSIGVVFADELKMPGCILQKRDGTHGYLASDLSSIKYRKQNWNLEKIIYFVDGRQQLHLRQVFEIAKQAGWLGDTELIHAYNGFISLKDGAMSTRKGRIIKLEALLDEAELRAEKIILEKRDDIQGEELKTLSKTIGIGAIKYGYLKKNRESDIVFDWDEFMSFEGNSGPYIQYAYVRARKILEKEGFEAGHLQGVSLQNTGFETSEEIELAKKVMNFNSTLRECIEGNYPHVITSYAYDLTKAFSSFYNAVRIKETQDENTKQLQLLLVNSFSET